MKKHLVRLFLACLASADVASAVSFTVSAPVADAFVVSGANSALNYGGAGAMQLTAAGNAKGEFQSLIRFDVAAAVAVFDTALGVGQWRIDSASLSLGTNFGAPGVTPNNPIFATINAGQFEIRWMQNDTWTEGTGNPGSPGVTGISFATLPNFLSAADRSLGVFGFTAPGNNTVATYALGLDASFASDLALGSLVSFQLLAADSGVSYLFNSRSFGTAAQRPQLILSAVAIPESAACATLLGAVALISATLLRRRSRA